MMEQFTWEQVTMIAVVIFGFAAIVWASNIGGNEQ